MAPRDGYGRPIIWTKLAISVQTKPKVYGELDSISPSPGSPVRSSAVVAGMMSQTCPGLWRGVSGRVDDGCERVSP